MTFSISNDGIEWPLEFEPDSVFLNVKDLVSEMTPGSQEIPLAAWSVLVSHGKEFLNNHLALVPITPNQQGTMEMRDQVLSIVDAQNMDTTGYQLCDLENIDFQWEYLDFNNDAAFRPGTGTPFFPSNFNSTEVGSITE